MDLSLALRFGCIPKFFTGDVSCDPFLIHHRSLDDEPVAADPVSRFLQTADDRLLTIWRDLQEFAKLCDLAAQTTHKLAPNTFSEIMVSVLYRLLSFSFEDGSAALEAFRLGMITLASQVFFQWRGIRQRQDHLDQQYHDTLQKLRNASCTLPLSAILWLLFIAHSSSSKSLDHSGLGDWTRTILGTLGISSWKNGRGFLKPIIWIDYIHDVQFAKLFDSYHEPKVKAA